MKRWESFTRKPCTAGSMLPWFGSFRKSAKWAITCRYAADPCWPPTTLSRSQLVSRLLTFSANCKVSKLALAVFVRLHETRVYAYGNGRCAGRLGRPARTTGAIAKESSPWTGSRRAGPRVVALDSYAGANDRGNGGVH